MIIEYIVCDRCDRNRVVEEVVKIEISEDARFDNLYALCTRRNGQEFEVDCDRIESITEGVE